jgi:hypothetical protein
MRDQHVTVALKSGHTIEFDCSEFATVRNGFKDAVGFNWKDADRYVWLDFEQVSAVTVETISEPARITSASAAS